MQKKVGNTKAAAAYRALRSRVQAGEFKPRERLTELRVCEMLNIGRTVAREALVRLEAEGLISGRGAYAGRYIRYLEDEDPEELLHHYEVREVVEGLAARLAAKNMTGWQIDRLRSLQQSVARGFDTGDTAGRLAASVEFHRYLLAHCGNPLTLRIWDAHYLMPTFTRLPDTEERIRAKMPKAKRGHELAPVVEAIASHDPEEAERRMRGVVRRVTDAIRKVVLAARDQE